MNETLRTACKEIERDLVVYHYGECTEAERGRVESHIANCASCRRSLEDLRRLLPLTIETDEPPEAFWESYSRELSRKLATGESRSVWWKEILSLLRPWPVPVFATAMILIMGIVLTFSRVSWRSSEPLPQEKEFGEVIFRADNLDFFKSLEFLDSLDLLEELEGTGHEGGEA